VAFWFAGKLIWLPLYVWMGYYAWQQIGFRVLWLLLAAGLAVGGADFVASGVLKKSVQRLRPCHEPALRHQIQTYQNKCGGQFGFVSSHAANTLALAFFWVFFLKGIRKKHLLYFILIWALLQGINRIYLGVHYPSDVLGGWLVGTATASAAWLLFRKKILPQNVDNLT
jgi:undecaprenyl-diphosphatase